MFAGPNGSGKSVLKSYLPPELLGFYLNPDEIEDRLLSGGFLEFGSFGIEATAEEALQFLAGSPFLASAGLAQEVKKLAFAYGRLEFGEVAANSYFASVIVDFIRQKLMEAKQTFTFETVMSHPGKVEFLAKAQQAGYRTYLYYVATADPQINISRVQNRVTMGGHPVPEDRITSRYEKSLALLMEAIRHTNRAYIFDNSTDNADRQHTWLAEITDGATLELKTDRIPAWFKRAVLDKIC